MEEMENLERELKEYLEKTIENLKAQSEVAAEEQDWQSFDDIERNRTEYEQMLKDISDNNGKTEEEHLKETIESLKAQSEVAAEEQDWQSFDDIERKRTEYEKMLKDISDNNGKTEEDHLKETIENLKAQSEVAAEEQDWQSYDDIERQITENQKKLEELLKQEEEKGYSKEKTEKIKGIINKLNIDKFKDDISKIENRENNENNPKEPEEKISEEDHLKETIENLKAQSEVAAEEQDWQSHDDIERQIVENQEKLKQLLEEKQAKEPEEKISEEDHLKETIENLKAQSEVAAEEQDWQSHDDIERQIVENQEKLKQLLEEKQAKENENENEIEEAEIVEENEEDIEEISEFEWEVDKDDPKVFTLNRRQIETDEREQIEEPIARGDAIGRGPIKGPVIDEPDERKPITGPVIDEPDERKPIDKPTGREPIDEPDERKPIDKPTGKEPTERKPIDKPDNSKLPVNSGLQVYRNLLNIGPELTKTNRIGYGRLSELPVIGMVVRGIGKAIGSKKYRKETSENINNLSEEDYNLLTEYLTPDKIVELKVPMPFLDSLVKVHEKKYGKIKKENTEEIENDIDPKFDMISKKVEDLEQGGHASKEQVDYYKKMGMKLADKKGIGIEENGILQETKKMSDNMHNLKSGLEYRSFRKRDNYAYFGRRQIDNKKEVNELADMEIGVLEGKRDNDEWKVAKHNREMEKYMGSQSKEGKAFGIIRYESGAFNKKGIVTDVSDRVENRPATYFYAVLGAFGAIKSAMTILKDRDLMNQLYQSISRFAKDLSPEEAKNVVYSAINDMNMVNGSNEYINLEGNKWDISSTSYKTADGQWHNMIEKFGPEVAGKISSLSKLADTDPQRAAQLGFDLKNEILSQMSPQDLAKNVAQHVGEGGAGMPHGMQQLFATDAQKGMDAQMFVNKMAAEMCSKAKGFADIGEPEKNSLLGPIMSGFATIGTFFNNRRQANLNKNTNLKENDNQR